MKPALHRVWLFCAGAIGSVVALELLLRLFPVSVGLYQTDRVEIRPLRTYEAHEPFTYSMTWEMLDARHARTNNYGQLAPFDYVPNSRPVIVVGNSYVESQMNDYDDTLQGVLGRMLGKAAPVYGLGVSGMSIADYLALAGQASAEFAPRAAVFLIVDGDIRRSLIDQPGYRHFSGTAEGMALTLHPRRAHPWLTRARKSVGDLYLFRYATQNLRFVLPSPGSMFREAHAQSPVLPATEVAVRHAAIDRFLSDLPARSGVPPRCTALLVDGDRYAIYDPRLATAQVDPPEARAYFMRRATELGYRVADLEPVFRDDFARRHRHFDYYPVDRHLNGLGHRLAAEQAYRLLFDEEGGCRA